MRYILQNMLLSRLQLLFSSLLLVLEKKQVNLEFYNLYTFVHFPRDCDCALLVI